MNTAVYNELLKAYGNAAQAKDAMKRIYGTAFCEELWSMCEKRNINPALLSVDGANDVAVVAALMAMAARTGEEYDSLAIEMLGLLAN